MVPSAKRTVDCKLQTAKSSREREGSGARAMSIIRRKHCALYNVHVQWSHESLHTASVSGEGQAPIVKAYYRLILVDGLVL